MCNPNQLQKLHGKQHELGPHRHPKYHQGMSNHHKPPMKYHEIHEILRLRFPGNSLAASLKICSRKPPDPAFPRTLQLRARVA